MKTGIEILARELGAGTFDKSCSAKERTILRIFIAQSRIKASRTAQVKDYINFGTANGWTETPDLVKRCVAKKHSPGQIGIGKCLTEVKCELCRYKYTIDSSD